MLNTFTLIAITAHIKPFIFPHLMVWQKYKIVKVLLLFCGMLRLLLFITVVKAGKKSTNCIVKAGKKSTNCIVKAGKNVQTA